jgi:signal transduction histidine kinase
MTPLDLHAVVDRALGFCMHGLRHADITVERIYRDIPLVDGIEASLTQVFVNLITNAWHAMEGRGGGILSIRSRVDGARVVLEVSDDGPGIDADHLPHVFDQYFTTKPRGSGVGLGLSIVKQIIHDHRGTVSAENNQPSGARMLVTLPRSS